jgi:hypothetical protein
MSAISVIAQGNEIHGDKHLPDSFAVHNWLKQYDAYLS